MKKIVTLLVAFMLLMSSSYAQRYLTMHLQAGEYANYKNGASDQVHYQETGATENARFVVESIENSNDADLKNWLLVHCLATK